MNSNVDAGSKRVQKPKQLQGIPKIELPQAFHLNKNIVSTVELQVWNWVHGTPCVGIGRQESQEVQRVARGSGDTPAGAESGKANFPSQGIRFYLSLCPGIIHSFPFCPAHLTEALRE